MALRSLTVAARFPLRTVNDPVHQRNLAPHLRLSNLHLKNKPIETALRCIHTIGETRLQAHHPLGGYPRCR
jgi:hypothetical protein